MNLYNDDVTNDFLLGFDKSDNLNIINLRRLFYRKILFNGGKKMTIQTERLESLSH